MTGNLSWQIEQAKKCSCRGSDDYCPCQNVDFSAVAPQIPAERQTGGVEPLAWLGERRNLSLDYYCPVYGDDDDLAEEWRVTRVSGPINDREWTVIAAGPTPTDALLAAIRANAEPGQ